MFHRLTKTLGLPRFEYVYVLCYLERPWSGKVGFTDNFQTRRRDIQRSIEQEAGHRITLLCLVCLPVLFARPLEQAVHRMLPKMPIYGRDYGAVGSGSTEWYRFVNFLACAAVLLILAVCGFRGGGWWCLAMLPFIAPLPFDFALIVAAICLAQYAAIAFVFYALFWFVTF